MGKSQPELGLPAAQLNHDLTDASETSALLGTDPSGQENGTANMGGASASHDDGWDGMKDFVGLPWWRKPSVSCAALPSGRQNGR